MDEPIRVLMVEDAKEDAELLIREMKQQGLEVVPLRVDTAAALEDALRRFDPHLILSDYSIPGFSGLRALEMCRERCPETPFIFVSGTIGEERAIETLRQGASDYILKDRRTRLVPALRLALREALARNARKRVEQELEASERRFRAFMQHLAGAAYMKDVSGRFTFVNDGVARLAGKPAEECLGRTVQELFPSEFAREYEDNDQAALSACAPVERIERVPLEDGIHWFLTHKFPILGEGDRPVAVGGIALDVTERMRQQERIARLSRVHAMMSGINAAIIRIRDRGELLSEACRIAVQQGGFHMAWVGAFNTATSEKEILAVAGADGVPSAHIERLAQTALAQAGHPVRQAFETGARQFCNDLRTELTGAIASGQTPPDHRSLAALPLLVDGSVSAVLVLHALECNVFDREEMKLLEELAADVSFALDYQDKQEKLSYVSYYDTLTGLANRRLFFDRLGQMIDAAGATGETLGVVAVDLRRFRDVNETFGRGAGDRCLSDFASRMQAVFPAQATVARIGGDRFAVAVGEAQAAPLARLIDNWIRKSIYRPPEVQGLELRLAFKVGIAMYPGDGDDAETLFKNAEAALRQAKDAAEPYAFYAPEMTTQVSRRMLLESRLQAAVEQKRFALHYQPKLDLKTRTLRGLEALLRWPDSGQGAVSPAVFIPMLEQSGMIVEVGDWVLRTAVADMRRWQAQGYLVPPVAVNVSQLQLRHRDFVATVSAALAGAGTPHAARLDLEITESLIMQDTEASIAKLAQLRALGVRIHMDDFGTGYSSLSQIARLPLDALKIDRAFVADMQQKGASRAIVSTIISLARALGIVVIAEGVETEEQAGLLAALHCEQAQGWLFSKALPAADIVRRLDGAARVA